MSYYPAQLGQDKIVDTLLHGKENGTFLDIGASYAEQFSNTFFFEKERNWKGLAVELNPVYAEEWMAKRPNSIFCLADAATVCYQEVLDSWRFPQTMDFLSIDIDPPYASWLTLQEVMKTSYDFNVIAFEVDYGGDIEFPERVSIRDPSRELLRSKGYIHVQEIYDYGKTWYHVDDIWVNKATFDAITPC
jgi:hypothetical protein